MVFLNIGTLAKAPMLGRGFSEGPLIFLSKERGVNAGINTKNAIAPVAKEMGREREDREIF